MICLLPYETVYRISGRYGEDPEFSCVFCGGTEKNGDQHAVRGVFDGAGSIMALQDHPHQIKSQTASAGAAAAGTLCAVKSVVEVRQRFLADMDSCIFHCDDGMSLFFAAPDADLGSFRRVERSV